ncbi:MAG TPA: 8-oxoguanine DNA glycosylase, partial [Clostridiales bacterium]|nr:8-oxoguanine DNA glycosylase [Clostridiales bacterium]
FDLNNDYSLIKNTLCAQNETLKLATNFASGIRILNQPPYEMIISFIISANNNIKRIQSLVEKLSAKCGKNMGEYYAFPTVKEVATLSVDELKQLGMGFRAKYIYETTKKLENFDLETLRDYDTVKLLEFLSTLSGVGPKVADCIALFAYHKMDCFPVDTWVEKIYNSYFSKEKETNRAKIRQKLVNTFGNLSGYAQQYLFYYKRELDKKS